MAGFRCLVACVALVGLPEFAAGQSQALQSLGREPVMPTVRAASTAAPVTQSASVTGGWIEGHVTDDRNRPVSGAAVTAQGRDLLLVQTDRAGQFTFHSIPAGTYLLRVQGRGFIASKREFLQVMPARGTRHMVRLRRLAASAAGPEGPHVMAAGASLSQTQTLAPGAETQTTIEAPPIEEKGEHDHTATAWRLRHMKRPVLRDTTKLVDVAELDDLSDEYWRDRQRFDLPAWTADMARATASFLSGTALSGRVQLLTASAFDKPFEALSSDEMPAGIAYFSLGAPVSTRTTWAVEAAVTQGDVASWFVGGTYATILADTHGIDVNSSYSRQRYHGANPAALAVFRDDNSRHAGGVQIMDRWTLSQRVLLTYGGRYEHYDYLDKPGLFSPSIMLSLSPADRTWVRVSVSQRMLAPGAEEFVPQTLGNAFALPPQRTFAPLVEETHLARERTRTAGIGLEREVASLLLGVRFFRQAVDDQLVSVFGLETPDGGPRTDLGHYGVARGGSFGANGWAFLVSRPVASHVRGSLEYRTARANWLTAGEEEALQIWAPSAVRPVSERVHDFTARIESEIPRTATRVLATYRINTAYTRSGVDSADPGSAVRFDVQLHQGIPFMAFTRARWELLMSVRNLFHDTRDPNASLYDELMVVRPPKRVIGGVTVQF